MLGERQRTRICITVDGWMANPRRFCQLRDPKAPAAIRHSFVFFTRKALNQRSLSLVFPCAITWRLHCINRVCNKQSQSSVAIAVINCSFI
jgi:hypothetical protein